MFFPQALGPIFGTGKHQERTGAGVLQQFHQRGGFQVHRVMWSISRPGQATTISASLRAWIWGLIPTPP
jgi:hypothetical protein